jgi:hypothetical protein
MTGFGRSFQKSLSAFGGSITLNGLRPPGVMSRDKNDGVYNGDRISMVLGEGRKPDGERSELYSLD